MTLAEDKPDDPLQRLWCAAIVATQDGSSGRMVCDVERLLAFVNERKSAIVRPELGTLLKVDERDPNHRECQRQDAAFVHRIANLQSELKRKEEERAKQHQAACDATAEAIYWKKVAQGESPFVAVSGCGTINAAGQEVPAVEPASRQDADASIDAGIATGTIPKPGRESVSQPVRDSAHQPAPAAPIPTPSLVRRLRSEVCKAGCNTHSVCLCATAEEAAERIEKLERELAEVKEDLERLEDFTQCKAPGAVSTSGLTIERTHLENIKTELLRVLMGAPFDHDRWTLHLNRIIGALSTATASASGTRSE